MFDFQGCGEEGKVAPVSASKTWNSRFPARCSLAWRGGSGGRGGEGAGRPQSFFFFFFFLSRLLGWSRAVMHKTFSVLSFLILTLERADFSFCFSWVSLLLLLLLSLLFCLHLSAFLSVAGFFSSKPGIHDAERKPGELTTVSFLRFWDP